MARADLGRGGDGGTVYGAGVLPLLSHALDQAWRHKIGDVLTQADYERTWGIKGAVAGSAQRAFDRLPPAQQTAARQVFTRLTTATSDGTNTARRADRTEPVGALAHTWSPGLGTGRSTGLRRYRSHGRRSGARMCS
jgi:hypothetical protein